MVLKIVYRDVGSLVANEANSRTHTEYQIKQIADSIEAFGWTSPILVDEENGVIAGHARVMAAMQLGMGKVPTIELKGLTPAQRRAYVIADNKLALNAGWDETMLSSQMKTLKLQGFDLVLTGFDMSEIGKLPDTEPEPSDTTRIMFEVTNDQANDIGAALVDAMRGSDRTKGDVLWHALTKS